MRGRRTLQGWIVFALAAGVIAPSACGGRSALDDGSYEDEGHELGGTGGTPAAFGTGGSARGGSGGRRGGRAGAAGSGGTSIGGAGGTLASGGTAGVAGAATAGAGGAAGTGSGGAAGAGASPSVDLVGCSLSTPLDGGFARCESGLLHRPGAGVSCFNRLPRESAFDPEVLLGLERLARDAGYTEAEISFLYTCREDTDCVERPNGYCALAFDGEWAVGVSFTACRYACSSDTECGGGTLCQCGEPAGKCVSATCFSDAECDAGLLCAPYDASLGCGPTPATVWACQRRDDDCSVDAHCAEDLVCRMIAGRRTCAAPPCN